MVLRPRQMEGAAAKLQEEDEAHLVGEFWFMSTWVREWSRTKWRCAPGRQRGQQPSSRRRRMGPTLVRELRLVSSRTVSRAGLEEDGAHSSYSYNGLWGVTDTPQPTPVPSWQGQEREWKVAKAEEWWRPITTSSRCQGWSRVYMQSSGVVCVAMRVMTQPAA